MERAVSLYQRVIRKLHDHTPEVFVNCQYLISLGISSFLYFRKEIRCCKMRHFCIVGYLGKTRP